MKRIVLLERETLSTLPELRRPSGEIEWVEYDHTKKVDVAGRLKGANIAIINKSHVDKEVIDAAVELEMIATTATGFDNVDLDACRARGIVVTNVAGYAERSVPEHTLALILALSKSLPAYSADVAASKWQQARQFCLLGHPIRDLSSMTLGIFGAGTIGRATGRMAEAIGMKVLYAEHKGATARSGRVAFDEVISTADILSFHAPLTADTRGMIGDREFAIMQQQPIIINTGRGSLVDERAMVAAFEAGRISGIGFDVLTVEPPEDDNPLLKIAGDPRVIITPHVAWASPSAVADLWSQTVNSIERYLGGTLTQGLEQSCPQPRS